MTLRNCESIKLEGILNSFRGIVSGPVALLRLTFLLKNLCLTDTLPLGIYQILLRARELIKTLGRVVLF